MGTRHNLFRLLLRAKKSAIGSWGFLFVLVFLVFGVFFCFCFQEGAEFLGAQPGFGEESKRGVPREAKGLSRKAGI